MKEQHVYIIGSKGIPAKYGGFETFVEKLTENQNNQTIQYHVACMADNSAKSGFTDKHFVHNNADCFNINVPNIGPARAIYYDIAALNYAIEIAGKNKDVNPIFYVLACRIGPFVARIKKRIKSINGQLILNPDGHEWLRAKWSYPVRKYWKLSERLMTKNADLVICDSKNIENYIQEDYKKYCPQTTYIAYGTDLEKSTLTKKSAEVLSWYERKQVEENEYYLVVGRFVPENNYETMIREFMKSTSKKNFILITDIENNKFYDRLKRKTHFNLDSRIKFVGTVYNQELLKYIRENAFAYLHGHEVGGTNPSLLEALASTKLNLLLDVGFNREVGEFGACYWSKNENELAKLLSGIDNLPKVQIEKMGNDAKKIVNTRYQWKIIIENYETTFLNL